jgi:hypothetical protein
MFICAYVPDRGGTVFSQPASSGRRFRPHDVTQQQLVSVLSTGQLYSP